MLLPDCLFSHKISTTRDLSKADILRQGLTDDNKIPQTKEIQRIVAKTIKHDTIEIQGDLELKENIRNRGTTLPAKVLPRFLPYYIYLYASLGLCLPFSKVPPFWLTSMPPWHSRTIVYPCSTLTHDSTNHMDLLYQQG
jgi:hypothetical protein